MRARSIAIARITAISGISGSANRIGSAPSTAGASRSSSYGAQMSVRSRLITTRGPRENHAITRPVIAAARIAGRRHSQITHATTTRIRAMPRNVLYSDGPVLRRAASSVPATDSGEIAGKLARSAEK